MAVTFLSEREKAAAKQKLMMAAVLQFTLPGVPCIFYGDENAMEGYRDPFCRRCFDWDNTDEELLAFYRKLGALRKEFLPFREGDYDELFSDSGCIVYERRTGDQVVYIYVNNSNGVYTIHFDGEYLEHLTQTKFSGRLTCDPYSYGIFTKISK